MVKQTLPTRALLVCGAVAGPIYVTLTMVLALTRQGFDLRQHRFSWLTTGDLGWIHRSNMLLVGMLTVLLAVGVRQVMRTGRGGVWGPRLLGLFGAAYAVGGLLKADRVPGFPPGTTPDMVQTTWQGAVQNGSRGVSTLLLISVCLVLARWWVAEGQRGWAWLYGTSFPAVLATLTAAAFAAIGDYRSAFAVAILATPWIVVTVLAIHLYRHQAGRAKTLSAMGSRPAAADGAATVNG